LYLFVVISFYVNLFFIRLTNKRKGNVQMTNSRLQMMIATALFTAIIGILAQITIPLPFIPITGQTLAIGLAATILVARYSTYSAILYMIIGGIGVPVFSQMTGGLGILFGPTGGFIIGFIPTVYLDRKITRLN